MARLFLALLSFMLIAAAPPTLAPDAEVRWIDFAAAPGGQIRFTARVDGRDVVALLDTGVSQSVLARGSAAIVPARLAPAGEAVAIGGGVPIARMAIGRVELGPLARDGGTLLVAPLEGTATSGIELLVGQDLLAGVALDIDYPARRFRFLPSGRLPFAGEAVSLVAMPGRGLPLTTLAIGGRRLAPMLVDTGDGAAATLARAARDVLTGERITSGVSWGLAGPVETEVAVVPALALGAATAREVEVRVEAADGFAAQLGLAGRIGGGLLARYRVLIDPGAGRMVLAADPAVVVQAPPRSTSGLLVRVADDRLRVLHVMRGGPAAAAGWRAGEEICAVDGRRVAAGYAASPLARWTVGAPGTTVALTPCGGAPRLLRLTRFY